ncbi:proteasome assembly chaperone 2 [Hordeum vulgare]|nr:proteasome assembly chaperone 2 [Hordeum vulgare]
MAPDPLQKAEGRNESAKAEGRAFCSSMMEFALIDGEHLFSSVMEFTLVDGEQFSPSCSTLVMPAVSIGNMGQLAVDLLIPSARARRMAYFDEPSMLPCVGNELVSESQILIDRGYQIALDVWICMLTRVGVVANLKMDVHVAG